MVRIFLPMSAILFRADGSSTIGTGHVMRCLALAQACRGIGSTPFFLSAKLPETLAQRIIREECALHELVAEPYGVEDRKETIGRVRKIGATIIVVDGYGFDADYQRALRAAGLTVLFLDDCGHATSYDAQFVLNQNAYADERMYAKRQNDTVLLLGSRYCLLRQEFLEWKSWKRSTETKATKLLLTLGGADPQNATGTVLKALQNLTNPIEATVVVGDGNPHLPSLQSLAKTAKFPVNIVVNATEMPRLMAENDMAISAGGSTCYELAFMRLPMLTIVLADNQKAVAASLEEHGCSVNLGNINTLKDAMILREVSALIGDAVKRTSMAKAGGKLVDGEGADRVLMRLTGSRIRLRLAREEDARMLWEWANDPETRQSSFVSGKISWETHLAWFKRVLEDPAHCFWIALDNEDTPLGSIRFASEGKDATLSVSTAPEHRGKGFGTEIVKGGCKKLFDTTAVKHIHAHVKPENVTSKKLFLKTGFLEEKPVAVKGNAALHFSLDKDVLSRMKTAQ